MIFLLWQKKKIKLKNGTKYDDIQAGDSLGIFLKIFSPMLTESGNFRGWKNMSHEPDGIKCSFIWKDSIYTGYRADT